MEVRECVLFGAAGLIRVVLLCFGNYQDQNLRLKYTDVDYHVFTDAARFITQGESPFRRSTFRYSPVLALLLLPNALLWPVFGKLLFCACDLLCGRVLLRLLRLRGASGPVACVCVALWLLNPLCVCVSSRGSAEAVLAALVLSTLLCVQERRHTLAALLFGLAVHMKIYPVTYALPIALSLAGHTRAHTLTRRIARLLSPAPLLFAGVSASVFFGLGLIFYRMYGWEFVREAYLYHVTRRDVRHNFSPFFYLLYVSAERSWGPGLALVCFLPQLVLILTASLAFARDLPFCCFVITALFVSFNKVCTSQYFLWYLCLLPLLAPRLSLGWRRALLLLLLWSGAQALWLCPAYLLEFEGQNTFSLVCVSGLLFLLTNCCVLGQIIGHYTPAEPKQD